MMATHHKASLWPHAVSDCLYPAVRQHHAVLPRDLGPVALLLLVEVIADVILNRVTVSVGHQWVTWRGPGVSVSLRTSSTASSCSATTTFTRIDLSRKSGDHVSAHLLGKRAVPHLLGLRSLCLPPVSAPGHTHCTPPGPGSPQTRKTSHCGLRDHTQAGQLTSGAS